MRLLRIEAERYGALQGAGLGDVGAGLTVVLGPNEAGKSTYTALVRHVLYGFPTPASKSDRPYTSDAGNRVARLVFADEAGEEWTVERTEGPRGGPVDVRGPQGKRNETFLTDLTRGVSDTAFRVVFGFGLDEMAQIEQLRGGEDDIIGRLYAASAGLSVSPMDVRREIEEEAGAIFLPRGRREVNELLTELKTVRERIRDAGRTADEFRGDRERLSALDGQLEDATRARGEAQRRLEGLKVAMERVEKAEARIDESEAELKELRLALREAQAAAEAPVDESALQAAPVVDAALEDLSACRQWIEDEARHRGASHKAAAEITAAAESVGSAPEALLRLPTESVVREELGTREDALRRSEAQLATAREQAAGSASGAQAAEGARPSSAAAPGIALVVVGLLATGAGVVLGGSALPLGAGLGLVVAAVGVWMLLGSRAGAGAGAEGAAAVARSREDAAALARAQTAMEEAQAAWTRALAEFDLPEGTPAQTRLLLEAATAARTADTRRAAADAEAKRLNDAIQAYRLRLGEAAGAFAGEGPATAADIAAYAAKAKASIDAARQAAAARDLGVREADTLRHRIEGLDEVAAASSEEARKTYESLGMESGGSLDALRREAETAGAASAQADQAVDALVEERSRLAERLDAAASVNPAAELRARESTLEEQLAEAGERYAVLAVASELLKRAQDRYERDRQPEVVTAAQSFLSSITAGRYRSLRIPLGDGAIEAVDETGKARSSGLLSRGTVEQMYLALRLGLVARMGEAGADLPLLMDDVFVNFDPERARGAAQAVAELALNRQVVLFTCHPATLALLEDVGDPTVIRLERC